MQAETALRNEELLTREELADRWKCHIETVKRATRSGALRCVRIGRLVRYHPTDIAAYEAANRS